MSFLCWECHFEISDGLLHCPHCEAPVDDAVVNCMQTIKDYDQSRIQIMPGGTVGDRYEISEPLDSGPVWTEPFTGMEFVWVPGGCFKMGSNVGNPDEKPVHKVCVDGFWMGKYEVTQGQWQQVMGNNPSKFKKGSNYPVEYVSWDDCQLFISKLNGRNRKAFRLPTEAEWEYACRSGGRDEKYAGGNDLGLVAWYSSNSGSSTHAVGTKAVNGLGLYDMNGNVWEWCLDWHGGNYYSLSPIDNPQGPSSGLLRVNRGGSWDYTVWGLRSTYRSRYIPSSRYISLGCRLVSPGYK